MKGVIMAGGFGTRLRPLTFSLPKPMVPVANRPVMQRTVELLRAHGITDQVSLLYFQPDKIRAHFGDGSSFGVRMAYVGAEGDLGTAGSVKLGEEEIGRQPFMVISADVLTDFDLGAAIAFHRQKQALATMVLTRVENPLQFGVVITDQQGRITRFLEKPTWGEVFSDTINTGIYIFEPEILDLIPPGKEFDFSKDLFPLILSRGLPLFGYVAQGYWKDIGTLTEYLNVHRDVLSGRVEVGVDGERMGRLGRDVWSGSGSLIDPSAKLSQSVILGRFVTIGAKAELQDCVIGDGCVIGGGARIQGSVLWEDVSVGAGAELKECTIASHVRVGDRSSIDVGAVVADHCWIGADCRLKAETKMWPQKRLEDRAILSSSLVWGEKWSLKLFNAYGVAGIANTELTPEFATKLGAAFGSCLPVGSKVVVTRDAHKTSRMLDRAMMAGLMASGVSVHDMRLQPVPVARFITRALKADGGLHLRRSPLERAIQDIKFFDAEGCDLSDREERRIEELFHREDLRRVDGDSVGDVSFPARAVDYYLEAFLAQIDVGVLRLRPWKIVVDYAFGSATGVLPNVLARLGIESISLNAFVDETRMTRTPAEREAAMQQLGSIVPTVGADLGVMLDASGQKLFLCDENGGVIQGDLCLLLFTKLHSIYSSKAIISVPLTASRHHEELAARSGAELRRCGMTNRSMMQAAIGGATLAGDERGSIIFGSFFPGFDAMFAAVKLVEYLALSGRSLGAAVHSLPRTFIERGSLACPEGVFEGMVGPLIEGLGGSATLTPHGLKLRFGSQWALLWPDPDLALLHVDAEAESQDEARALVARMVDQAAEVLAGSRAMLEVGR